MRHILIGAALSLLGAPVVITASATPSPAGASRLTAALRRAEPADATTNDNTKSAGTLRGGVLTLRLYAAEAKWHPGPADAPPVVTALFGEEGHAPSTPGPLLRVPLGTRIDVTIRNAQRDTLLFVTACMFPCRDTVRVAPGASGQLAFTPKAVGTFVY